METKVIPLNQVELITVGNTALQPIIPFFEKKKLKGLGYDNTYLIVKLTRFEYRLFIDYIRDCNSKGFSGIHNYTTINEPREFFYRWFLDSIIKKISIPNSNEVIKLKLNLAEVRTLHVLFKRVDCCENTLKLQKKFFKKEAVNITINAVNEALEAPTYPTLNDSASKNAIASKNRNREYAKNVSDTYVKKRLKAEGKEITSENMNHKRIEIIAFRERKKLKQKKQ